MRKGFYFDSTACTGCRTCQIACAETHHAPQGIFYRWVNTYTSGTYPDAFMYHLSLSCNHCENPVCVTQCPTGAMYIDEEDGTIQHNDEVCIGCRKCVKACPYDAPKYCADLKIVRKCDACIELRAQGEDPACVASCLMRALKFGPKDELEREYGSESVADLPVLPSSETTHPTLFIKAKESVREAQGRPMIV